MTLNKSINGNKSINSKKLINGKKISAFLFTAAILIALSLFLASCSNPFFIRGVSIGYFISQDNEGRIHILWSADKKDNSFTGTIKTDGIFETLQKEEIEEEDSIQFMPTEITISATLNPQDYYDEIIIKSMDFTYIEFDLKLNGQYDLSRINIGKFINNPSDNTFRLSPDYFEKLGSEPVLNNHPFSEFLRKLYSTRIAFFIYLMALGAIVIEILRITKYNLRPRKKIFIAISYAALLLIDIGIFVILVFTNGN